MALAYVGPEHEHEHDLDPAKPTCRQAWCSEPASGPGGLCEAHQAHQVALRARAGETVPGTSGGRPVLAIPGTGERPAWHEHAACRGMGTDLFYPAASSRPARTDQDPPYADARKLCATCPVAAECAGAGAHEPYGLWAGHTPTERRSSSSPEG